MSKTINRSVESVLVEDTILSNVYKVKKDSSLTLELPNGDWVRIYSNEDGTFNTVSVSTWDKERLDTETKSNEGEYHTSKGFRTGHRDIGSYNEETTYTTVDVTNFIRK